MDCVAALSHKASLKAFFLTKIIFSIARESKFHLNFPGRTLFRH